MSTEKVFILEEDQALKNLLSGFTVTDGENQARPVRVWFGMPDDEIRRQQYPYIVIDLLDVIENREQVQTTYGMPDSTPYLALQQPSSNAALDVTEGLLPMLLVYQIATYARQPRHDRAILSHFHQGALHPRFAQILVNSAVTGWQTMRRLVVTDFAKRDTIVDGKRLFRNIWTVQVPSETYYDADSLTATVDQVTINNRSIPPSPPSYFVINPQFIEPLYP